MIEDPCQVCGAESDVGCHGVRDGVVYDQYFCEPHYHDPKRDLTREPKEVLLAVPRPQDGETGNSSETEAASTPSDVPHPASVELLSS